MCCMGEHIVGGGFKELIAAVRKKAQITGQGGGVTGNIDDVRRGGAKNGVDECPIQTFARRINDDNVRRVLRIPQQPPV